MRFLPGIIEDVIHPLPGIILFFSTISLFAYTGFFLIFGWILMIYLNKYRRILFVFCMFTTFIVDPLFFMSAFACSCNKESMVKVNMHNLQIMLETYALDQGKYPENLSVLEREAKNPTHNTPSYWMNASNPMQYEENKNNYHIHASEILIKQKKANLYESFNSLKPYVDFGFIRFHYSDVRTRQIADYKGMAIYDRISDNQYYIYGVFYDNELIQTKHKRKRENYYILTNG
ncbi:MAG: hypothetical protein IV090_20620 [Candidatus Sericytochromatia bacterium]|nr:hypothetical protein [Candidatus Sericytochromatia bacterium]